MRTGVSVTDATLSLTVIIVTRNRPDDLAAISLPSLAVQTCRSFDVLVWDASADDATRLAVADFAGLHPSLTLRYARAPRAGTSAQRNDALDSCTSDLVFYIDDDTELYPTAIAELLRVFEVDTSGRIAGCQCTLVSGEQGYRLASRVRDIAWLMWYGFWGMWYIGNRQVIRLSGFDTVLRQLPRPAVERVEPGMPPRLDLGWLQGCTMAFRRHVLCEHDLRFDERLMRFGSYSKGEDVLFSGILHTRLGYGLACAPSALAIHHVGSGPHGATASLPAMIVYNHWLIWRELMSSRRYAHLAFAWARTGLWLRYLIPALLAGRRRDVSSFREGLRATHEPWGES
jgi:glycosyltransferase involved in cell wall biosynthesis